MTAEQTPLEKMEEDVTEMCAKYISMAELIHDCDAFFHTLTIHGDEKQRFQARGLSDRIQKLFPDPNTPEVKS